VRVNASHDVDGVVCHDGDTFRHLGVHPGLVGRQSA
jgi:hypothetical protein